MRGLLLGCLFLFVSGCLQNRSELERVRDESRRVLADEQKRSAGLTAPGRADLEPLMEAVRAGVEAMPELQKEIDALPRDPPPVMAPLPALPESGAFEGVDGARLRAEIAMIQTETAEVRRMNLAMLEVEAERKRLEAARALIEARRAK